MNDRLPYSSFSVDTAESEPFKVAPSVGRRFPQGHAKIQFIFDERLHDLGGLLQTLRSVRMLSNPGALILEQQDMLYTRNPLAARNGEWMSYP